jgi:hypothetical protein
MERLTIRMSPTDDANLLAIASAMRTNGQPFVTRSAALKLALAIVAKETSRGVVPFLPPVSPLRPPITVADRVALLASLHKAGVGA